MRALLVMMLVGLVAVGTWVLMARSPEPPRERVEPTPTEPVHEPRREPGLELPAPAASAEPAHPTGSPAAVEPAGATQPTAVAPTTPALPLPPGAAGGDTPVVERLAEGLEELELDPSLAEEVLDLVRAHRLTLTGDPAADEVRLVEALVPLFGEDQALEVHQRILELDL